MRCAPVYAQSLVLALLPALDDLGGAFNEQLCTLLDAVVGDAQFRGTIILEVDRRHWATFLFMRDAAALVRGTLNRDSGQWGGCARAEALTRLLTSEAHKQRSGACRGMPLEVRVRVGDAKGARAHPCAHAKASHTCLTTLQAADINRLHHELPDEAKQRRTSDRHGHIALIGFRTPMGNTSSIPGARGASVHGC